MAKKNPSKKTLKSLFSKSEQKLDETVEEKAAPEEKKAREKKKFKFPGLKIKSKGEKSADETQQVLSVSKPAEDGEDWADSIPTDAKKSTLYATAPRSKGKEFSYSELDLRKPKRFATFSFGLKKKKKKDGENISKSTFGLHSSGIEEQEETVDFSQMEVDQTNVRKMISMSQPELDTNETFDIPSPPPVAVNQSESAFPLPNQSQLSVVVNVQPEPKVPLMDSRDRSDVQEEMQKAPIATIPELQLEDEKENAPVHDNVPKIHLNSSDGLSKTDSASAVAAEAAPTLPARIMETSSSDYKAADPESVCGKSDVLEHSNTKDVSSLTESTSVTLSHNKPDAPVTVNNTTANAEASLTNTKTTAVVTEPTPLSQTDDSALKSDFAAGRYEVSTARTDRSMPKTAESSASALSSKKSTPPVNQTVVYGALYDSLFPQSFASEVKSSLSAPASKTYTEIRHVDTKSTPVLVKTLNKRYTEAIAIYSTIPTTSSSHGVYDAPSGYTNVNTKSEGKVISSPQSSSTKDVSSLTESTSVTLSHNKPVTVNNTTANAEASLTNTKTTVVITEPTPLSHIDDSAFKSDFAASSDRVYDAQWGYTNSESKVISSPRSFSTDDKTSYEPLYHHRGTSYNGATPELQTEPDALHRYKPSAGISASKPVSQDNNVPYSQLTRFHSGVKLGSIVQDADRSVNAAPPVSDYVTSHETDTQVTDSKRKVILVKELVTDETSADSGCPSPVSDDKMAAMSGFEIKTETTETFSTSAGQMERYDAVSSPAYLSVGSDDGSAMEIYYSAEEENEEEEDDDEVYTAVVRKEISFVDGMTEEFRQREQMTETSAGDEGDGRRLAVVKMEHYGDQVDSDERLLESPTEMLQQLKGQRAGAQVQENGMCDYRVGTEGMSQEKEAAALLMKEDWEDERKEEFPATPVQQVNALEECEVGPPSSMQHGEGSGGRWTAELGTENHQNGEKQLHSNWDQYLSQKDIRISEITHLPSSKNVITPILEEAEQLVLLTEEANKRGDESLGASPNATKTTVTETSGGVEVVTDYLTHSTELQSDATGTEHNRALQRNEGVDTITESAERNRTEQEQVAVELSARNTDAHQPVKDTADTRVDRKQHLPEEQPDLNEGSLTTLKTLTTTSSEDLPTKATVELGDNMYKVFSSLSTTLSTKSTSSPQADESKHRFHKVSLVTDVDQTEATMDTVDFIKPSTTVTESNGTDTDSEYKWKNRFDGVYQFQSQTPEYSRSDSLSYSRSDTYSTITPSSSSSALPEATAYKSLSTTLSSSPSSSPPPPEEHIILSDRLSDKREVYLSRESEPAGAAEPKDEWRRSFVEEVEPSAPAGERHRESEGEAERIKSHGSSEELTESGYSSSHQASPDDTSSFKGDENSSPFTGVFKATRVALVSDPAAPPSSPPASPDVDSPNQCDMDTLVDTLKNMGPSMRLRTMGLRGPAPVLVSSLPPIVEDAPNAFAANFTDPTMMMNVTGASSESVDGLYTLPADLGLKRNALRDARPPLELMKYNQQDQPGTRGFMDLPHLNGNDQPPGVGSRLDNSIIFSSFRSASVDLMVENGKSHRSLIRAASLPETGPSNDRMSVGPKEFGLGTDPAGTRFERFSFLLNSSPSTSGSLTGAEDLNSRLSRPLSLSLSSPPSNNSPTRLLSPTGSIDLHRPSATTDSPMALFSPTHSMGMGTPILQRSFSNEGAVGLQQSPLINMHGGPQFQGQGQLQDPENNLICKYRAFPDAYLTKEKEHGKLNPRPGKMYIFDQPGMCGQRIEIRSDVVDATSWELQETISIRVVRGGWVLYEKANFKGEKIALDEGDIEITYPFNPPEEELQNGQKESEQQNGEQNGEASDEQTEGKPTRRFIIGSIRRAVRDYSVPEISLFPEENAEGKKVIFRDTSEDARIFGFPIKANSIIVNAGLWLVYAKPFFQGFPKVLEVGGYTNPAAWGVEQPYVASLHPLKVGEPRVENLSEPKMVVYEKPYFTGKSRTITTHMKDFMTRMEAQQTAFMYNVGSLKVLGGIWVGYEKAGFRGHQYLLEEGEYQDWRVWGGRDAELRSVRVIRADFTDPMMVMLEQPEDAGEDMQENTFEVTEAIPDVELYGFKTSTRSIHVLSGAWIAYSHVDFSGSQYILEKGLYNNCADWGSEDNRICSVQPILMAPRESTKPRNEIILYREPDFKGECQVFGHNRETLPDKLLTKSCRVTGGSWVLYDSKEFSGNMYVVSEGEYPNLTSMGCPISCTIRSIKAVPMMFAVPSISLFGLECLEGREITADTEIVSMMEEGFNTHILSVRVNSGCWVICEHSNYRGRQFLLEPIEITNWPKFSSLQTIGSMYPVRQKRCFFRIRNKERDHFMSVQGGVEEMKSGRVVVTPEVEPMSDIWFYQDGLIKNKLASNMSLQVMGNIEPAAKVVLWTETRQPVQTWTAQTKGLIVSLTFPGMVLDLKGGKTYDKDHVVIMPENEERPSQQWEIVLL